MRSTTLAIRFLAGIGILMCAGAPATSFGGPMPIKGLKMFVLPAAGSCSVCVMKFADKGCSRCVGGEFVLPGVTTEAQCAAVTANTVLASSRSQVMSRCGSGARIMLNACYRASAAAALQLKAHPDHTCVR